MGSGPDAPGASPTGGWAIEYGDAFGDQFGTGSGQDNTLYPNSGGAGSKVQCSDNPGYNTNEMEVFNCSQTTVDAAGLHLACSWSPNRWPAGAGPDGSTDQPQINYVCGAVAGNNGSGSPFKFFAWQPRQGETWAFQCVCELPPNTGEADPGWWSTDPPWTQEIDYVEGWGWGGTSWANSDVTTPTWIYDTDPFHSDDSDGILKFDPSAGFHIYTTVILPNNTYEEFIDGALQKQYGNNGVIGPVPSGANPYMNLLLSYGLREQSPQGPDPSTGFYTGSRSFNVESISVYENATANGANTKNSGLAPGTTTLSGLQPPSQTGTLAKVTSSGSIALSWGASTGSVDHYGVWRWDSGSNTWVEIATVPSGTLAYTDSSVSNGVQYEYGVRGYDSNGDASPSSNIVNSSPGQMPSAPGSLTQVVSSGSVALSWAASTGDVSHYGVWRWDSNSNSWSEIATVGPNTLAYSDSSVTGGVEYQYGIRAYDTSGDSSGSSNIVTSYPGQSPSAPGTLTGSISNGTVNLSWGASTGDVAHYGVWRWDSGSNQWSDMATVGPNTLSYSDATVKHGVQYEYGIRAYDTSGDQSPSSNIVDENP